MNVENWRELESKLRKGLVLAVFDVLERNFPDLLKGVGDEKGLAFAKDLMVTIDSVMDNPLAFSPGTEEAVRDTKKSLEVGERVRKGSN